MGRSALSGVTRLVVAMAAFIILATRPALAQEAEVRAAIDQIFEGMRTADSDMVRAVFASEARFAMVGSRNGPATIRAQSPAGWFDAIGTSDGNWDEQVYDVEVLVEGNMALAWAPFTFYMNGEISHCGINSIALLKDAEGWKVTQLSDTRSSEECPDPLGGR